MWRALSGFAAPGDHCCLVPGPMPWLWPAACLSGVPLGFALVRRVSSGPVALGAPVGFPVVMVPSPTPGGCCPRLYWAAARGTWRPAENPAHCARRWPLPWQGRWARSPSYLFGASQRGFPWRVPSASVLGCVRVRFFVPSVVRRDTRPVHQGSLVWTPTPLLSGQRTPRPGTVRVWVSGSRERFGAPHLSFGRFVLLLCSAPSGLGLPLSCFFCFPVFFLVARTPAVFGSLCSPARAALGPGALVFFSPDALRPSPAVFFCLCCSASFFLSPPRPSRLLLPEGPLPLLCFFFSFFFFLGFVFFWEGGFPCSFVPTLGFRLPLLCDRWCCCCAVCVLLLARWGVSPWCRAAALSPLFASSSCRVSLPCVLRLCPLPLPRPCRCSWCSVVAFVLSCCCAVCVRPLAFVLLGSALYCAAFVVCCACWPCSVVSCGALASCAVWCAPPPPGPSPLLFCLVPCRAAVVLVCALLCCVVPLSCGAAAPFSAVVVVRCLVSCSLVPRSRLGCFVWSTALFCAAPCGPGLLVPCCSVCRFAVLRWVALFLLVSCRALVRRVVWCGAVLCVVPSCLVARCCGLFQAVWCRGALCRLVCRCVVLRRAGLAVLFGPAPPPLPPCCCPCWLAVLCVLSCFAVPCCVCGAVVRCTGALASCCPFGLCRCRCLVPTSVVVCCAVSVGVPCC